MAQSRKEFLKTLGMGALSIPFLVSCSDDDFVEPGGDTGGGDTGGVGGTTCELAPNETAGPFPTISPSSYVREDIREDRSGYKMDCTITITDQSNNCAAIDGAIVDIWHCDAEGNYSEYGGSGMQPTNYTGVHFLRGRQVTDANGQVNFTSIFPGWYRGRANHIHVHVYDSNGNSLKITQIAFPEGSGSALLEVGGYDKGMNGYTYNSSDNVFSDDSNGVQVATVTGSTSDGFTLTHQINV